MVAPQQVLDRFGRLQKFRELAAVGSLVFRSPSSGRRPGYGDCVPDLRWPEPQDFEEADEIEMPGYIKN